MKTKFTLIALWLSGFAIGLPVGQLYCGHETVEGTQYIPDEMVKVPRIRMAGYTVIDADSVELGDGRRVRYDHKSNFLPGRAN